MRKVLILWAEGVATNYAGTYGIRGSIARLEMIRHRHPNYTFRWHAYCAVLDILYASCDDSFQNSISLALEALHEETRWRFWEMEVSQLKAS